MSVRRRASRRAHYNYFRDYDPAVGRYVESDPIGLRGGLNTYQYANAQPNLVIDPNGLDPARGATWGSNIGTAIGGFVGGPGGAWVGRLIGGGLGAWIGYKLIEDAANDKEFCPECTFFKAEVLAAEGHTDPSGVTHTGLTINCLYVCPDGLILEQSHFIAPELAPYFAGSSARAANFCPRKIKQYKDCGC